MINYKGSLYMRQRKYKDVWQNLFDFYLVETTESRLDEKAQKLLPEFLQQVPGEVVLESPVYEHILTHQKIMARFFIVEVSEKLPQQVALNNQNLCLYNQDQIEQLPKPVLISSFLNDLNN